MSRISNFQVIFVWIRRKINYFPIYIYFIHPLVGASNKIMNHVIEKFTICVILIHFQFHRVKMHYPGMRYINKNKETPQ